MTDRIAVTLQTIAVAAIAVGYAAFAHLFSTATQLSAALLPLAVLPISVALALKPRLRKWSVLPMAGAIVVAFIPAWRTASAPHLAWLYFAQDSALSVGLALLFGSTLRGGAVPLCSQMALLLQAQPSMRALRYTRGVTWAWTLFFIGMASVSALLFLCASRQIWSTFANLLYWPLLLAMFAFEYFVRLLCLPRAERPTFAEVVALLRRFRADRAEVSL